MCQLIESIKVENKKFDNIRFHNARMNNARKNIFDAKKTIEIENYVKIPDNLTNDTYKCRITYRNEIEAVEFDLYTPRVIKSFKIVFDNKIDYKYKKKDRTELQKLFEQRDDCDDILIVKNNLMTDTFFSNVILLKNKKWYTPAEPLLRGTKMQALIEKNIISEANISINDLAEYTKIMTINAMLDFDESRAILISMIK